MMNTRGKIKKTLETCRLSQEDSDHQSAESGALIIGSNDDLLIEILLRLPVTSILRFKSVSKHWRWLLSQKSFTLRFDKLSKPPGLFVARNVYVPDVENRTPLSIRALDSSFDDDHDIKILQSCNGLLFCYKRQVPEYACRYYVYNPTTRQSATVPLVPGGWAVRQTTWFMGLAYHPTDCVYYKVICIRDSDLNDESLQIQIYSSDTREWKISIQSFSVDHKPSFDNGVYWNGAFHWVPSREDNLYFFKIDGEQLQSLALPAEMVGFEIAPRYIGESRGQMHLIGRVYRRPYGLHVNVYEMLSDHSGWFVKYQVELGKLLCVFPEMTKTFDYTFKVIDVVRGEKDEDTFLVLAVPSGKLTSLITYNVHDSSFKGIFTYPKNYYDRLPTFHRYTETLTSFQ